MCSGETVNICREREGERDKKVTLIAAEIAAAHTYNRTKTIEREKTPNNSNIENSIEENEIKDPSRFRSINRQSEKTTTPTIAIATANI